jgi:hypothetical protein
MTELDNITSKIAPLIRLLSSPVDQEVLAAARALLRLLTSAGLDIHALADRIEAEDDQLSAAEMQKIYDAAYAKGFGDGAEHGRNAVLAGASPRQGMMRIVSDVGVNGYTWQEIAAHCLSKLHLFIGREAEFVESIAEQVQYREPSEPQAKWLRDLFLRKCGGRIS